MIGQIAHPAFGGYRGYKHWEVRHPPSGKTAIVRAPDQNSAIVAAAKAMDTDWRPFGFHGMCEVKRRKDIEEKLKGEKR